MDLKKAKKLNDFTIFEFNKYVELTKEETPDVFSICELFGFNIENMEITEFQNVMSYVNSQVSIKNVRKGVKKTYDINGVKYKATLNLKKIVASQFIDLQIYTPDNKLEEILSVILIPMEKKYFGLKYVEKEYGKDYDIEDVQKHLLHNFKIGDANELSAFFLQQSTNLLRVTKDYLAKKEMKMKMTMIKQEKKQKQK
jgi:hypothetical protein